MKHIEVLLKTKKSLEKQINCHKRKADRYSKLIEKVAVKESTSIREMHDLRKQLESVKRSIENHV